MGKIQEKQVDNFKQAMILFLCIGFLGWATSPLWGKTEQGRLGERGRLRAEAMAFQLIQIYQQPLNQSTLLGETRKPASAGDGPAADGEIGRDPWGDPYQFQLTRDDSGGLRAVRVWSRNMSEPISIKTK